MRAGAIALVAAAVAGVLGFLAGSSSPSVATEPVIGSAAPAVTTPQPLASASSGPTEPASATSRAEPSVLELAASGDLRALKLLEIKKPGDRSPEEALAISAGLAALARTDASRLAEDLAADPKLFGDRGTMAYLYRLALDPDVAPTLLAALTRLESPIVADLLYDLVARGEPGARLVLLAEDLLRSPAVLPEASKPLALVLDLRAASSCERAAGLVKRASSTADERAVPLLERYRSKTGCGPKNADDCFSCLRGVEAEKLLDDAIVAAKARPFEAPWRLKSGP